MALRLNTEHFFLIIVFFSKIKKLSSGVLRGVFAKNERGYRLDEISDEYKLYSIHAKLEPANTIINSKTHRILKMSGKYFWDTL